jgi:hypothetical protein
MFLYFCLLQNLLNIYKGGYVDIATLNNGVYVHEVVVHAQNFVDPIRPEINTQTVRRHVDASKKSVRPRLYMDRQRARNIRPSVRPCVCHENALAAGAD